MTHPARLALLKSNIPDLFTPGTLLNVGANRIRFHLGAELHRAGRRITLLEIWPANAGHWRGNPILDRVVCGDVRTLDSLALGTFDTVLWWHGPEHIKKEELPAALAKIEAAAERLVVLGCPYGVYPQGPFMGNPHDAHSATLYPEDFEALGYKTATLGKRDDPDGGIIAWKYTGGKMDHIPHVVMVTHGDRLHYLERTLPALSQTTYPFTLTVVANKPGRSAREYLTALNKDGLDLAAETGGELILNRKNLGKPAAANRGWRVREKAAYTVLLDDDMLALDPDWLRKLVDLADIPEIGIVGHSVESGSWPFRTLRKPGGAPRVVQVQPSGLGGACILVPKRTVALCGRYNEELPPYGESDALYGWKVRRAGLLCAYFDHSTLGRSFEHLGEVDEPKYRAWKDGQRAEAIQIRDRLIREYEAGRPLNQ